MKKQSRKLSEFDFSLVLGGVNSLTDALEDSLFEAGCDDATLCLQHGAVYAAFSREAESLKDAIISAIKDVLSAGYEVQRVDDSDLVTPADIARRIGRTRQLISQYMNGSRGPGGFPSPECHLSDDASPLWSWCAVSRWLASHDMIRAEEYKNAEIVAAINNTLESMRRQKENPTLAAEVTKVLTG